MGGNQFTYGIEGTAGGRGRSIASGNSETCFWKGEFLEIEAHCLGTDVDSLKSSVLLSLQ
jgi:hypothetical protein